MERIFPYSTADHIPPLSCGIERPAPQVVHHLFPGICHCHYPALSEIVKRTAAEFGLPYKVYPTVRSATRICERECSFRRKLTVVVV